MNKIGTEQVQLRESMYTLPIAKEHECRGLVCTSWAAMGFSSLSPTVLLLPLPSATGKQTRDRGRWCRGSGSCAVYDGDGGPALVRRTTSSMRQMRCDGRVRRCRRGWAGRPANRSRLVVG